MRWISPRLWAAALFLAVHVGFFFHDHHSHEGGYSAPHVDCFVCGAVQSRVPWTPASGDVVFSPEQVRRVAPAVAPLLSFQNRPDASSRGPPVLS